VRLLGVSAWRCQVKGFGVDLCEFVTFVGRRSLRMIVRPCVWCMQRIYVCMYVCMIVWQEHIHSETSKKASKGMYSNCQMHMHMCILVFVYPSHPALHTTNLYAYARLHIHTQSGSDSGPLSCAQAHMHTHTHACIHAVMQAGHTTAAVPNAQSNKASVALVAATCKQTLAPARVVRASAQRATQRDAYT
jgi:hypothetical protein